MMSNFSVTLMLSSQFDIVVFITIDFSSTPKLAMFSVMTRCATRPRSTKTTDSAPRLSASNPIAPEPAKASSTRAPRTVSPSELNIAERTRSPMGCVVEPGGAWINRPPNSPAMMRSLTVWSQASIQMPANPTSRL